MKYVAIFHANLNYAYLEPHKYERVIRASYENIITTFRDKFPHMKYVFEASGYTIDQMATLTPDVLKELIKAVERGQCEFMGAPYSHPIMANIPEEDGVWSNLFSMKSYQKHLGFKPESAWNPECTWKQYVPHAFKKAGFKYLTLDFESYMNANDKEYGWVERGRTSDLTWGAYLPWYDLDPNCKFLHRPFRDIVPGLHGFCRSDRVIGMYPSYFMGATPLEKYLDNIKQWTGSDSNGATVIIAEDAEYTGTTAYFYIKRYQDYSRSFEIDPEGPAKLEKLLAGVDKLGELITFKQACELKPVEEPFFAEDHSAWHRASADAWCGTPEAKTWDPIISVMRNEYKEKFQPIVESDPRFKDLAERFWLHLTNASNSDGRWPPPPAITCLFNRQWVLDEMEAARKTLKEIEEKTRGVALPKKEEADVRSDTGVYGMHYTDKDTADLTKLNFYELSHHMYKARYMVGNKDAAIKAAGDKLVDQINAEFKRRGFEKMGKPLY